MGRVTAAVVGAIAAVAVVSFGFSLLDQRGGPPIVIDDPRGEATIVVAIAGAVASPGVYALAGDARTGDALAAAGGPLADADLAAINPARRLADEERVLVPRLEPAASVGGPPAPPASAGDDPPAEPAAVAADPNSAAAATPIDLNTATVAELETLPEIGPVLAGRIVDYRTERGPFRAVEELIGVQGVSARTVEALRALVTVGA